MEGIIQVPMVRVGRITGFYDFESGNLIEWQLFSTFFCLISIFSSFFSDWYQFLSISVNFRQGSKVGYLHAWCSLLLVSWVYILRGAALPHIISFCDLRSADSMLSYRISSVLGCHPLCH